MTFDLLPDAPGLAKPLFQTNEDYDDFRETFIAEVSPKLEAWRLARLRSESEARDRWVD